MSSHKFHKLAVWVDLFKLGWRMGWTVVHDASNIYRGNLSKAINKLTTRLVGPNTLIQARIIKNYIK